VLLRRIGVLVAVIVFLFLFALARISSIVVDWAWFSSIAYVGRLLDSVHYEGRSLRGCLRSLDPASLGERSLGAPVHVEAAAASGGACA
jgi:hypothetical protein